MTTKAPPRKRLEDPAAIERAAVASFRRLFNRLANRKLGEAIEPWDELAAMGLLITVDPNRWPFAGQPAA